MKAGSIKYGRENRLDIRSTIRSGYVDFDTLTIWRSILVNIRAVFADVFQSTGRSVAEKSGNNESQQIVAYIYDSCWQALSTGSQSSNTLVVYIYVVMPL